MGKEHYQLKIVKNGALIKFGDDDYGFISCDSVEKVDDYKVNLDGHEVSGVYIRYLNDYLFNRRDEKTAQMAEAAKQGLGNAIRNVRKDKDMSQADFSVNKWTISELERGKLMSRPRTINKVAEDLDMEFAELLSEASLEMWKEVEDE